MTTDPQLWATGLETLHAQVWARLVRGVKDRHAPARHPGFATVSPTGWPEVRTVVLRAADVMAGTLDIHTDLRSDKVLALQHNPRAALHVWDAQAHLQTRIEVTVTVLTGAQVAEIWAKVPDPSRQSYGTDPAPGLPIASALAYDKRPNAASFAVLRCTIEAMDILHLGQDHRRARFERADGWAGQWLAP
ncbi:MAG: Pyridoxamine 5'-phosphate oxidase family protein [Rhodobacteraceae bacterium]|uniref:pyridoxamine 5'-phosphate oxidase family protein n=1 Tax=Cypionkella sp. TaxID=2811411 RepID=UPI001327C4AF|nr:pyridoxamine 5'-phosphate oxidase family protein [Cypionkella sp.]KAF0173598.1 MAG: Pyridoxamine 5'-phosphate oxidase family protein [Paracoccaceae bacterium]MDO8328258.1 pyridoxamine 5'-phosphate oxidase family protein [Cypionkella sp.]